MPLQMTVRVVAIYAYDDGILGHGLTHRVTLLSAQPDGTVQGMLEMNVADPQIHEALAPGHEYVLTLAPVRRRRPQRDRRVQGADG